VLLLRKWRVAEATCFMQHVGVDCVLLVIVLSVNSVAEGGSLLLTSLRCI
jgi:hypothetical protein